MGQVSSLLRFLGGVDFEYIHSDSSSSGCSSSGFLPLVSYWLFIIGRGSALLYATSCCAGLIFQCLEWCLSLGLITTLMTTLLVRLITITSINYHMLYFQSVLNPDDVTGINKKGNFKCTKESLGYRF